MHARIDLQSRSPAAAVISERPSLATAIAPDLRADGLEPFLERYAADYTFYGSGKAALRDGLDELVGSGDAVLVPASLPDAVVEPFHDLGSSVSNPGTTVSDRPSRRISPISNAGSRTGRPRS